MTYIIIPLIVTIVVAFPWPPTPDRLTDTFTAAITAAGTSFALWLSV